MTDKDFELPKTYDPSLSEERWRNLWEQGRFSEADAHSTRPSYTIVMPPPNVTGVLHMGHALVNTLQDILVRWKRMCGYEALWVPGTDHAGIATQAVVERHLMATLGKRRIDFERDEFVKICWQWKEKHENTILMQLKRLGCSCDWSRLRFTMDEGCNQAVKTLFKRAFDQGLIFRGDYLVNWDPVTQTALADDEVEYEEKEGSLWYFKFPLSDGSGYAKVATTRPETMLGDVAVAVSPRDSRYSQLIGKTISHPLTQKSIPIISDSFVDPSFGTGMVKITPAHDPTDYQMGLHHNLPMINILTPDGKINENGGIFEGLSKEAAREKIIAHMKDAGLLEKIEPYKVRLGVSYRSKAVIEPYLSKQWFVKMGPFKQKLIDAVKNKKVKIIPPLWEHTYFHWVENLRDWCISRQLWWGHRIPVWYRKDDHSKQICYAGEGIPPEIAHEADLWEQESDVLDTWFSSALWPFSTLGWPDQTKDLEKFYPTSVLVTGHDILFFWVARMILMGEYTMGQVPFPETFLHGLIYGKSYWRQKEGEAIVYVSGEEKKKYDLGHPTPPDVFHKWEKLSKSKGNVIDPLEMIETYGTDALRMALCSCANQTPQIDLDRRRFEEYKNFTNKIWNGARFVLMHLEDLKEPEAAQDFNKELLSLEDHWILLSLQKTVTAVNGALASYSFDQAAEKAYNFFWNEFCAYYVEITKPILYGKHGSQEKRTHTQKVLFYILTQAITLLHPMAPFITEELYQLLKGRFPTILTAPSCMVAPYPQQIPHYGEPESITRDFALFEKVIYAVRNIRGEMKIPPHLPVDLVITPASKLIEEYTYIIRALVKVDKILFSSTAPSSSLSATAVIGELSLSIPLPKECREAEQARLLKEKEKLLHNIESLQIKLSNKDFIEKANPAIIQKQRETLQLFDTELQAIVEKLKLFADESYT